MSFPWFMASRYLRSKHRTGFVSTITYIAAGGVILGVAALVIMLSVTNGFTGEVKERLIGMQAHVTVQRLSGEGIEDFRGLVDQVGRFPGVAGAAPIIESKVLITARRDNGEVDGVLVWGVESASFGTVSDLHRHLRDEPVLHLGPVEGKKVPGIVLGSYLARRMKVGPGDEVLLMTVANMAVEEALAGVTPKLWPFVVTDTFESGLYQYDDNFAFISLADAQRILDLGDTATTIHIRVTDPDQAVPVRKAMDADLHSLYLVRDWTQHSPELFRWMELEKWVIFIALSLIIVVAAFNIMSNLIMSILIKTPEIGILRAMGATAGSIRRIFVYQGLAVGVLGTGLGCFLGFAVCFLQQHFNLITIPGDIYFISSLPVDMQPLDFLLIAAVSLSICLMASIYPARKAAALLPVEAIRYIV
ncbi:MAG: FtsX-like permease family protein [Candidatus Latescibacteria bacterium]|nr:FtsX-like permease family protein [Candidatus Latescibacterota bacterium]